MKLPYHALLVAALLAVGAPAAVTAAPPDPAQLALAIDARLAADWDKAGVKPAAVVDDATFLRRASLDLVGRIPTVAEVRAFLADTTPDKRVRLVHRLIDSGGHARHMATFWRRAWIPQADTPEFAQLTDEFESWMVVRLQEKVPYDRLVRELLTVPVSANLPAVVTRRGGVTPVSFFAASENKPELLAANFTRAFLGVNLDCAQCHNHPFARWSREQFWQTAAFFASPKVVPGGKPAQPMVMIPNTERTLSAAFMDKAPVTWPETIASDSGRRLLAEWVTGKDNAWFARNAVNRLWTHLLGTGMVEPLDDLSGDNPASNPALLDELTRAFVASGYDLQYLTRAIALSKAYQLSAGGNASPGTDPRLFARMPVRGLTGEQLYDSLRAAAGLPPERDDNERGQGLDARRRFAARFLIGRAVSADRSIVQALALMNGSLTKELTDPAKNPTLRGVVDAPFLDAGGKVEALFLATLARKPTAKETSELVKYVESGGPEKDASRALADVFWALLNSTEFNTNH